MKVDIPKISVTHNMIIQNDYVWGVDIDDTLLLWDVPLDTPGVRIVEFQEPHLKDITRAVINENNLRLMKEKKVRGCFIILWSQGGYEYAIHVANALYINDYVDMIMTKPVGLIDDLPSSAWLPQPVNIPYTKNYKKPKPVSEDTKEIK